MTDWTEEKILRLIKDKTEESLTLEYKRCGSLLQKPGKNNRDKEMTELSKDVSSFANAAGGELVYGVIEEKQPPHRADKLDEGFDPQKVSKEWLEDVITSRIQRNIAGLEIYPIPLNSTHPGRYAYVIRVPESATVHQAHDKRYYRRRNFKAEPMEDYEIREGLSRSKYPELEVDFKYKDSKITERLHEYLLTFSLENVGSIRAKDIMFECEFPQKALASEVTKPNIQHRTLKTVLEIITTSVGGKSYKKVRLRMTQGQVVIFPTERVNLEEYGLKILYKVDSDIYESHLDLPVCWRLYVDDAPPKEGQFLLRDIQNF